MINELKDWLGRMFFFQLICPMIRKQLVNYLISKRDVTMWNCEYQQLPFTSQNNKSSHGSQDPF